MKVLWFSNTSAAANFDPIKGTGGWMAALDFALQDRVDLYVAYQYPYNIKQFVKGKTHYIPIYTGNILVENIKHRVFPRRHKILTDEYLHIIDEVRPDIIHIHGTENAFHTILGNTNVPVVISIQGNPTVIAYKFRSGFHGKYENEKMGKLKLKSFIFGRNSFKAGLKNLQWMSDIEQQTLKKAKYIIGRTDWDRRITRILAPNSQYFIGNEALRDTFYKVKWENTNLNGRLIIHTTNGNNYYKGFETLCYALNLLNELGLDVEWRVAGISNESKIVDITKRFLKCNFPKKGLKLMGPLNETQLAESLLESHIYVMPSHIENSPNNLCEAMLVGMPCVATFAGGTGSMLEDKKEGLLVQDGDPWALAGAIVELKDNWDLAIKYGENARERASIRHNKEEIVTKLIETYSSIINDNNP